MPPPNPGLAPEPSPAPSTSTTTTTTSPSVPLAPSVPDSIAVESASARASVATDVDPQVRSDQTSLNVGQAQASPAGPPPAESSSTATTNAVTDNAQGTSTTVPTAAPTITASFSPPSTTAAPDSRRNTSTNTDTAAGPNTAAAAPSYPPNPANARALLTALEELRDSLSLRVDQLSIAVERLRGQASELDHAVSTGTELAPGFGRPRGSNTASFLEPLPTPALRMPRVHQRTAGDTQWSPATIEQVTSRTNRLLQRRARARVDAAAAAEAMNRSRNGGQADDENNADHDPPAQIPPRPRTPPRPRATGMAPTNLDVIATQPKPTIVRSPASSAEPSSGSGEGGESSRSASGAVRQNTAGPSASSGTEAPRTQTQAQDARPSSSSRRTASESIMNTFSLPGATSFADEDSFADFRRRVRERYAPPNAIMEPGMTLTGMRVEQRIRAAEEPVSPTSPVPPQPNPNVAWRRDELDRQIRAVTRRLEESQRLWQQNWNAERSRTLNAGGRVPNEYSAGRESAMRAHVENSHLLWTLVSRRALLYGASPMTELAVASDGPLPAEPRAPVEAMRHIVETSPSFLRPPNRPWTGPFTEPPAALSDASPAATLSLRERRTVFGEPPSTAPTDNAADASSDLSIGEMPTYRYTPLPRNRNREREQTPEAPPSRSRQPQPVALFDDVTIPTESRQRVRERSSSMARELSPDILAAEEPARMLNGIEVVMASPNLPPHMRARLERLAARERAVLRQHPDLAPRDSDRDILELWPAGTEPDDRRDQARVVESIIRDRERERERDRERERSDELRLARDLVVRRRLERLDREADLWSIMATTSGSRTGDNAPPSRLSPTRLSAIRAWLEAEERNSLTPFASDQVVERIERSRARARDLSRAYRELQATRAALGFEAAPRAEPLSRRGSDADTVVPPSFSVADITTIETAADDDEVPPPIPAPPARLTASQATTVDTVDSAESSPTPSRPIPIPARTREQRSSVTPEPVLFSGPFPPAVQVHVPESPPDLSVTMEETSSSASSSSLESSTSGSSNRATLSHARDETPSSERKETGELDAGDWPSQPRSRRPPRPYVSILDL